MSSKGYSSLSVNDGRGIYGSANNNIDRPALGHNRNQDPPFDSAEYRRMERRGDETLNEVAGEQIEGEHEPEIELENVGQENEQENKSQCKKYCFCTCLVISTIILLIMLGLVIASSVGIARICQAREFDQYIYLANKSVIEVDPQQYNINTLSQKIEIKCSEDKFEGSIGIATGNNIKWKEVNLKRNITNPNQSILRYWSNEYSPIGHIVLFNYNSNYITWSWSNLTTPPSAENCNRSNTNLWSGKRVISVSDIYNSNTRHDDEVLVRISFCSVNNDPIDMEVSITEHLPHPDETKYKPLYCNDEQTSVEVTFPNVPEIFHPSLKLYLDTTHLIEEDGEPVIEFEITEHKTTCYISTAVLIVSFLLMVTMMTIITIIVIVCGFCKNNYVRV